MPEEIFPPAAQTPRSTVILIVEDNVEIGDSLRQIIDEETPYDSVVVSESSRAIEQAQQLHPCLLLLDYRLPEMNGLELYDRLQEVEETRGVPAIMMSASLPGEELQRRGILPLHKPGNTSGVIRVITHALATFEEQHVPSSSPHECRAN